MNAVFADTVFFVAAANQRDSLHAKAMQFSSEFRGQLITSQWVLVEVANFFAKSRNRDGLAVFIDDLLADPQFECVAASDEWFGRGWRLYRDRPDKGWSLTDCISFEIMRRRNIGDAVTSDHHFEQAGFRVLMK